MADAEAAADDDGAVEHPCPVCLDNADDASVIGSRFGMCSACGQLYCGACHHDIAATLKCQLAVQHYHYIFLMNLSGCGSWCTTGRLGGTLQ